MAAREPPTTWHRLALRLEYATIAWNLGEAVLTIALGIAAASLALVGFGADSIRYGPDGLRHGDVLIVFPPSISAASR